jgi:hypothetical protein
VTAQDTRDTFASLDELQASHLELTQKFLYEGASLEKDWQEVETFIAKARATGVILSDDADRHTAQNLIDDWAKKLVEVKKEISDTELLPFDTSLTNQRSSSSSLTTLLEDGKPNFPSLLALQTAHADLNKRCRDGVTVSDSVWQEVKVFIAKGKATGALLADDNERFAAQSLLDYWATMLYRYKQESPDTTLVPFDESSVTELTDDDYPYRTLPMPPGNLVTARELRFAVEGPAKAIGLIFEDGVIEALLRDVRDEADAWSLLELMLSELWQKRQRNKITWGAYQELGGVAGLLSKKAETVYQSLESSDQEIAKKILLRLVRLDEWQQPTSHPVLIETLQTSFNALGVSSEKLEDILAKLEQAPLIKREDNGSVSLFHTAILKDWPRLAEWLQDEDVRERLTLTAAAEQWEATGRDEGALWWGKLLTKALTYRDLDKLEQEFLEVSRRQRERRTNRRNVLLSIGLASVVVLAALALIGWRYANLARRFAEAQSNIVTAFLDKRFDVALLLAVKTYEHVDEAAGQKGLLSALRYTQQAYAPFVPVYYLHGTPNDVAQVQVAFDAEGNIAASDAPLESWNTRTVWDLGGAELNQTSFTPLTPGVSLVETERNFAGTTTVERVFETEATSALGQVLNGVRADFFARGPDSEVASAALSPDGERLALGYNDGAVIVWRVPTPEQPFLGQHLENVGPARKAAFSQTGNVLAFSSSVGELVVVDVGAGPAQTGIPRVTLPLGKATPRSIALSADGNTLAWLEPGGHIKAWDVQQNQEISITLPPSLEAQILSLAFAETNELLLGQRDGKVTAWNLQNGNGREVALQGFEGSISILASSAKGILAVADARGVVSLWNLSNGEMLLGLLPINGYVTSLGFNLSGTRLALGTHLGNIILWDIERQETIGELWAGETTVLGLVFTEENSERLLSSSSEGNLTLWDIGVQSLVQEACLIANPPLNEEQYQELDAVCPNNPQ